MGDHQEEKNAPQKPNKSDKTRFGFAPNLPAESVAGLTDDSGLRQPTSAVLTRFGAIPPTSSQQTTRNTKMGQFRFEGAPETNSGIDDMDLRVVRPDTVYSHVSDKVGRKIGTLFYATLFRTLQVVALFALLFVVLALGVYLVFYDSIHPRPAVKLGSVDSSSFQPTTVRFFDLIAPGQRFLFLMDTTEQMKAATDSSGFLLIKSKLQQSLRELKESDFFGFHDFNSQNSPASGQEATVTLVPADVSHLSIVREKIENLRPRGSCRLKEVLLAALASKPDILFLVCHSTNAEQLNVSDMQEIQLAAGGIKLYAVEIADTIKPLYETSLERLANTLSGDYQWLNVLGKSSSTNEMNTIQKEVYEKTSIPPLTEMLEADFKFTDDVSRAETQKNSPFGKEIVAEVNRSSSDDSSSGIPKQLSLPDAEILEIETDARIVYMSGFTSTTQSPQMLRVGAENRLALWVRGAQAELPAAEYLIGLCYKNGVRVSSDESKAFQCQLKAALQGCQPAMFLVAMEYKTRNEINPSDLNAISYAKYWAEKGARLGEPQTQCFWANYFASTPEDRYSWLKKAADQGLPEAQYLVGKCFETGNGTYLEKNTAASWYEKAAKQGFAAAQIAVEQMTKADEK